ncbi:MAG: hypothetical protein KGL39_47595 [Patescibacteria group bacterium]|nr:hypothetical protein [Patescibacteria group bacterium]
MTCPVCLKGQIVVLGPLYVCAYCKMARLGYELLDDARLAEEERRQPANRQQEAAL